MADDGATETYFSDADLAFLRHTRFGELPRRVLPEQRVELTETAARRDVPDYAPDPRHTVTG